MSVGIARTNPAQVAGTEPQSLLKNLGSAFGIASPSLNGGKRHAKKSKKTRKKTKKTGKKTKKTGKKTKKTGKKSRKSRKSRK